MSVCACVFVPGVFAYLCACVVGMSAGVRRSVCVRVYVPGLVPSSEKGEGPQPIPRIQSLDVFLPQGTI